jgi:hypothetical protein
MIQPSALNLLIILAMVIIASFLWRMLAAKWKDNTWGQAMGAVW